MAKATLYFTVIVEGKNAVELFGDDGK